MGTPKVYGAGTVCDQAAGAIPATSARATPIWFNYHSAFSLSSGDKQELLRISRDLKVSLELAEETARLGRLPVVNFAAGGIATPADAALMMTLGCDGVFVGSGIFKAEDPRERARSRSGGRHLL